MNLPTHSSAISESSANGAARLGTPSAHDCAALIAEHFANYNATFRTITRRAPLRFDARDWHASQRDAVERIELYGQCINTCIAELRLALGERVLERALWRGIRADFAKAVAALPDAAFAKTFFSTVTRRLFGTVGVDPEIEFIATELEPLGKLSQDFATRSYQNRGSLELLIEDLLADLEFKSPWRDFDRSVQHLSADIKAHLATIGERRHVQRIDVIPQVFYQATRAYVVGRIRGREYALPLVIALKNTERGVLVDAVMLSEDDVSIVFSFTRSYFHVDLDRVADTVGFLKQLMPRKPVSELFTVLGRTRQGKAERYREIVEHLQRTDDLFVHAPGERGLVMICFTSPSLDVVFKLIRDRFAPPKTIVRQDVIDKYRFVFKHDRAGRLVDAQEFHNVRLPRARFADGLLADLLEAAASTVHVDGDSVVFEHMYIERRMTPLNIYLRTAAPAAADRAVLDYGQCIRDLAYTNIFAGDLLLKNFGVTRHGRVIFYDYDELCQVTDCRFRELPRAMNDEDELRSETWFYVAENDVFPETFLQFLAFNDEQRQLFEKVHGEILHPDFWRQVQRKLGNGDLLEVLPYHPHRVRVASSLS